MQGVALAIGKEGGRPARQDADGDVRAPRRGIGAAPMPYIKVSIAPPSTLNAAPVVADAWGEAT